MLVQTIEDLKHILKYVERELEHCVCGMTTPLHWVQGSGLVLVLVGVTYDPLTFYTDDEV